MWLTSTQYMLELESASTNVISNSLFPSEELLQAETQAASGVVSIPQGYNSFRVREPRDREAEQKQEQEQEQEPGSGNLQSIEGAVLAELDLWDMQVSLSLSLRLGLGLSLSLIDV